MINQGKEWNIWHLFNMYHAALSTRLILFSITRCNLQCIQSMLSIYPGDSHWLLLQLLLMLVVGRCRLVRLIVAVVVLVTSGSHRLTLLKPKRDCLYLFGGLSLTLRTLVLQLSERWRAHFQAHHGCSCQPYARLYLYPHHNHPRVHQREGKHLQN